MKFHLQGTRVLDLSFDKKLDYFNTGYSAESTTHRSIASAISCCKLESVIIFRSHLRDDLGDLPKFATRETVILCSKVEEEARNRMQNSYMDIEKVDKILTENGVDLCPGNNLPEHNTHKSKLHDAVFNAQELLLYPEILDEIKTSLKYNYNEDTDEEIERTDEEVEELWEKTKLTYLLPRTTYRWERKYDLPVGLDNWDSRNLWQQYFFIEGHDAILHARGGTGGSGSRWDLGIMIHAFAQLHQEGKKIKTHVLHYNDVNELHLLKSFDDFRCLHPSFGCNYHNPQGYEETENLVKDICIDKHDFIKGESNEDKA